MPKTLGLTAGCTLTLDLAGNWMEMSSADLALVEELARLVEWYERYRSELKLPVTDSSRPPAG